MKHGRCLTCPNEANCDYCRKCEKKCTEFSQRILADRLKDYWLKKLIECKKGQQKC